MFVVECLIERTTEHREVVKDTTGYFNTQVGHLKATWISWLTRTPEAGAQVRPRRAAQLARAAANSDASELLALIATPGRLAGRCYGFTG
jgi:hypothetical protein